MDMNSGKFLIGHLNINAITHKMDDRKNNNFGFKKVRVFFIQRN